MCPARTKRLWAFFCALIIFCAAGPARAVTIPAYITQATNWANASGLPAGFAMYPFLLQSAAAGCPNGVTDCMTNGQLTAMEAPQSAGIKIDFDWHMEEPSPGNYTWTTTGTTFAQIAAHLRPNQHVLLGIVAGTKAPSWLANAPYNVPFGTFYFANQGVPCAAEQLPVSYDANYIARYVGVTLAMYAATANYTVASDGTSLQSKVISIQNAGQTSKTSGEFGVFSSGCVNNNVTITTQQQTAAVWAGFPSPDNYTPAKERAAIFSILSQLMAGLPSTVSVHHNMLGSDQYGFPVISEQGTIIQPGAPSYPQMFNPIEDECGILYGARCINEFDEFSLGTTDVVGQDGTPIATQAVLEAGRYGAGISWQLNQNAAPGTSCYGKQDPNFISIACFAILLAYGGYLVQSVGSTLGWYEVAPADFTSSTPPFWPTGVPPLTRLFDLPGVVERKFG